MHEAEDAVGAAAEELMAVVARAEAFEPEHRRVLLFGDAAIALFRSRETDSRVVIVTLARERGRWEALGARTADRATRRARSIRPTEAGGWLAAIAGAAPAGAGAAFVSFDGAERRARIVDGFYAFAAYTTHDPGEPPLLVRFETGRAPTDP
jgi:hypothetical protein